MRKICTFIFAISQLLGMVSAEEITLSPGAQGNWTSQPYRIPDKSMPLQVKMEYVCTGAINHGITLQWLDENGKVIGSFLPRPPFHYPIDAELNKKQTLIQTVLPLFYPPQARSVRINISSEYFKNIPSQARTTFIAPHIEWLYRIKADTALNWFDQTQPVSFTGVLPPGKTGIRGVVRNSSGQTVADVKANGATWRFTPRDPGFYQVNFFWLDENGKESAVVEKFYCYEHKHDHGQPVRFQSVKEFQRDYQNFAVTVAPPRQSEQCGAPFGFNIMDPGEHDSYFTPLDDKFHAIRLITADRFIRYHFAKWFEIEKNPGIYDWQSIDRLIDTARQHGITADRIILNTVGTPRWNSPKPDNTVWTSGYYFFAPKDLKPWGNYLTAFSQRYPAIKSWELWNEPHLPGKSIFWQDASPEQFAALLKTGYQALKKVNPENTVILGGIGMRYLPFYDELIKLGGASSFDVIATHNGFAHKPFRAIEDKYNAPHHPFVETEWHVNLYNCDSPELPTEEDLSFAMLVNLANMLNLGVEKIAGFNVFTGSHTPETARYYMKSGGIQQVSGLFRSMPISEPRLSALALRTACDRFSGKITPLGAWYFGDGDQQAVLFESGTGKVLFFWIQAGKMPVKIDAALAAALAGKTIIDWEGSTVLPDQICPRRVYFVHEPNTATLYNANKLETISPQPKAPVLSRTNQGAYAPLSHPIYMDLNNYVSLDKQDKPAGLSARFAVDFSAHGLELRVETTDRRHYPDCAGMEVWNADSIQFAIDSEGKGFNDDIIEYAAGKNNLIYKTRMPVLKGDIPSEYTEAGKALKYSKVAITRDGDKTVYRISISSADLYPFVYHHNQPIRFSLLVNNNDDGNGRCGYLEWAGGIGNIKAACLYGDLSPAAGKKQPALSGWQQFQSGKVVSGNPVKVESENNGKPLTGITCATKDFTPGARYRLAAKVRGIGELEGMVYGNVLQRTNIERRKITEKWSDISLEITVPENEKQLNFAFFMWMQNSVWFEVKDFKVEALYMLPPLPPQ